MRRTTTALPIIGALVFVAISIMGSTAAVMWSSADHAFGPWTLGGFDVFGLMWGVACASVVGIRTTLPFLVDTIWHVSRSGAVTTAVLWLIIVLLDWMVVMAAALQTFTGGYASAQLLLFAGVWLLVEVIAGLLPFVSWLGLVAARQQAAARASAMGTVAGGMPVPFVSRQASPTMFLRFLRELVDASGSSPPGVRVAQDGAIVASQAALARAAACSKGHVNKCLHRLTREARIELGTTGRETRIRLLPLPLRKAA